MADFHQSTTVFMSGILCSQMR